MQRARFLHLIIHAWTRDRTRAARVTSECPTTGLTACVFVCQDSRLDKRRVTNIADCYASKARETQVCKSTPLLHESRRGSDHTQNTSIYMVRPASDTYYVTVGTILMNLGVPSKLIGCIPKVADRYNIYFPLYYYLYYK